MYFQHEDASVEMFKHLLKKNPDVDNYLRTQENLTDEDFIFIKEAIKTVDESVSNFSLNYFNIEQVFFPEIRRLAIQRTTVRESVHVRHRIEQDARIRRGQIRLH